MVYIITIEVLMTKISSYISSKAYEIYVLHPFSIYIDLMLCFPCTTVLMIFNPESLI